MSISLTRAALLAAVLAGVPSGILAHAAEEPKAEVIVPTETIQLLNGKDLSKWYIWQQEEGRDADTKNVFTLQPDGTLRISGEGSFGGLTTHDEYKDYHLVMEFRWGTATWGRRADRARDSGVLVHCQGPDGNYGMANGKPGPWMASIECQIIEGGTGDILVLRGPDENGKTIESTVTCEVTKDRDGEPVWTPGAPTATFEVGRINWFGRDPDWKDVAGFRGKDDVESPGQEWTTVECFCKGDELVYRVNGVVVNRATKVFPSEGKLILQTEGAELFVRRFDLQPLPKEIP
ncbi:3-keto-disaccharide hydrolase [Planctomicrobium sp. SH661]|uniref:3-keto-disaccharide hydrolase n=1 Tax=Planctomicrobium sp. SH661 TaxID=3448124 RepID=UPI003F5BB943